MLTDEYVKRVYAQVEQRDGDQPEFLQAVREVFETIQPVVEKHPEYEKAGVLERIVEPERVVKFRVAWTDDEGKVQVNRGYRELRGSFVSIGNGQGRPDCIVKRRL